MKVHVHHCISWHVLMGELSWLQLSPTAQLTTSPQSNAICCTRQSQWNSVQYSLEFNLEHLEWIKMEKSKKKWKEISFTFPIYNTIFLNKQFFFRFFIFFCSLIFLFSVPTATLPLRGKTERLMPMPAMYTSISVLYELLGNWFSLFFSEFNEIRKEKKIIRR